jgi:predicted nucleic acid-binding protein
VWISAVDPREQGKAQLASVLVEALINADSVAITPQIAAEFYDVSTRRRGGLAPILTKTAAADRVRDLLRACVCLDLSASTTTEAMRGAVAFQMRIYDAQIWAAARLNGVSTILTEDNQSRAVIEGVRYVDPFLPGFTLAHIGL